MASTEIRPPAYWVGMTLLVIGSPLILLTAYNFLIGWPLATLHGVAGAFSGHDVVQTADDLQTGFAVAVIVGLSWVVLRALHVHLLRGNGFAVLLYASLLAFPLILLAGFGANYAMDGVLAWRGYDYCTYHLLSRGKASTGTYVYVRANRPGACDAVLARFPEGKAVPGDTDAFDLP